MGLGRARARGEGWDERGEGSKGYSSGAGGGAASVEGNVDTRSGGHEGVPGPAAQDVEQQAIPRVQVAARHTPVAEVRLLAFVPITLPLRRDKARRHIEPQDDVARKEHGEPRLVIARAHRADEAQQKGEGQHVDADHH